MPGIDDLYVENLEPTLEQEGVDVPGSRSGFTDFINFGVFNGNFRLGPPDPSANIDVVGAASSNFLPGWRFVQSSNTTITAQAISRGAASLGSNLRFTFGPGVNTLHQAYIEQIVDIGGSGVGDVGGFIRLSGLNSRETANSGYVVVKMQYLAADGTIVGMPSEASTTYPFSQLALTKMTNVNAWALDYINDVNPPPPSARYSRYRIIMQADTSTASGDYLDLYDVRRERAVTGLRMTDRGRAGVNAFSDIVQSGSNLLWQPSTTTAGTTTTKRLLNYQLVAIPYYLDNFPAGASTAMLMGGSAIARTYTPFPAWIVGFSYRLSSVPTAGGASALKFEVWNDTLGSVVWTPATVASTTGAQNGDATQAVGTDSVTSGVPFYVRITTSGTYSPTTIDASALLWLAVEYDGL